MTFADDEIQIEPLHQTRRWQSCNYSVRGVKLFHERTYVRTRPHFTRRSAPTPGEAVWMAGGPLMGDATEQWLDVCGSKTEIEHLAVRLGGTAHAIEEFYHDCPSRPPHFLAFSNTEEALAFCRTDEFDRLSLTLEKHAS